MSTSTAGFTVERVEWTDSRAVALRAVMDDEMHERYANRMPDGAGDADSGGAGEASGDQAADVDAADAAGFGDAVEKALSVDPADIAATVLALDADGTPLGHAALRMLRGEWEVKRVIVTAAARGRGVATSIMAELLSIATAGGARRLILQTGDRQPEAVALYEKIGYTPIAIYEPYVEAIPFSLCFEKVIVPA